MAIRVKFKGDSPTGNHQIGHRGGVVPFVNNEATVSDAVFQEWQDEGYPIEKMGDVDPSSTPVTNYFAYHGPEQVAAMEKEMLSKQNIGDFPGLGNQVGVAGGYGIGTFNHADTPVNVVNTNSFSDQPVNPDNRLSPNRIPLVEMTDEQKVRAKEIREEARQIRKLFGVPTDETNALNRDFQTTGDPFNPDDPERAVKAEVEDKTAEGEMQQDAPPSLEGESPAVTDGVSSDSKPKGKKS